MILSQKLLIASTSLLAMFCLESSFAQQNSVLPDYPNSYEIVRNIVDFPEGRSMGSGNAIDVDSKGNIWVFERCGGNNGACPESDVDPVLQFTPDGDLLFSFGSGMFVWPHGVVVDDDDNLWLIDAGIIEGEKGNQIFKFTPEGELLLVLGEPGIRGEAPGEFNEPSDLAIGADGTLYIVDGHINPESNRRIVHMTADGQFIEAWGDKKATGRFSLKVHMLLLWIRVARMYVGDRTNNRLQVLSPKGELLAIWTHWGRPSGIRILGDTLYAVDSESRAAVGEYGYNPGWHRGIYVGSLDGVITDFIPDPSPTGATSFPEGIAVSDDGVIWGASVGDQEVLKFVKR